MPKNTTRLCHVCEGSGKRYLFFKCPSCAGKGQVTLEPEYIHLPTSFTRYISKPIRTGQMTSQAKQIQNLPKATIVGPIEFIKPEFVGDGLYHRFEVGPDYVRDRYPVPSPPVPSWVGEGGHSGGAGASGQWPSNWDSTGQPDPPSCDVGSSDGGCLASND